MAQGAEREHSVTSTNYAGSDDDASKSHTVLQHLKCYISTCWKESRFGYTGYAQQRQTQVLPALVHHRLEWHMGNQLLCWSI